MTEPPRSGFQIVEEAALGDVNIKDVLVTLMAMCYGYDIRITTPKEESLSTQPLPPTEDLARNDEHYLPEHLRPKPDPECADCGNFQQPGPKGPSCGAPYQEVL